MRPFFLIVLFVFGCTNPDPHDNREQYVEEIRATEWAFDSLAQVEGLAVAFGTYAAPDAVIKRSGKLIKGPEDIRSYYEADEVPCESLSWKPTHIEASISGDLASTYGDYVYTFIDSTGVKQERTGHFHTVWKRQEDGNWKFIWD